MKLQEYIRDLDSFSTTCGLWVNPQNVDDYRLGETMFKNGGLLDGKVFIGTLGNLSLPRLGQLEALRELLEYYCPNRGDYMYIADKKVRMNRISVAELYEDDMLDETFKACLDEYIEAWISDDLDFKAQEYLDLELPEYLQQL